MKALRITVLTYCETERDRASKRHDVVVDQVSAALRSFGHRVSLLHIHGDVRHLVAGVRRQKPDVVFNLAEMFGQDVRADVSVAGLLELLGVPFTGSSAGELYLAQDKALGKKLLAYHGVTYPKFAVFSYDNSFETGGRLRMPLFVKPARMDASIGIDAGALVHDANALMRKVLAIHDQTRDDALAEEFIDGRELYVSVVGNEEPIALPPIEMSFAGMPKGMLHVMDARAKFDTESAEYRGTKAELAQLPDDLKARIQNVAVEAYRALHVRDYGRVDMRLTPGGDIYVIEVNASCYLEQSGEFATAAAASGWEYPKIVMHIVELALARRAKKPKRRMAA